VDQAGVVLDVLVQRRRNKQAAKRLLRKPSAATDWETKVDVDKEQAGTPKTPANHR
jgi:transposase-like protein